VAAQYWIVFTLRDSLQVIVRVEMMARTVLLMALRCHLIYSSIFLS